VDAFEYNYRDVETSSAGLAPKTVRCIRTIIHRALRDARKWNLLGRNVSPESTDADDDTGEDACLFTWICFPRVFAGGPP
jgi:hypothetical protein